jgi:hypothetical protein
VAEAGGIYYFRQEGGFKHGFVTKEQAMEELKPMEFDKSK